MDGGELALWIGFNLGVLLMLVLDLGILHRDSHAVSLREAAVWSLIWVLVALAFNVGIYFWRGPAMALEFFTGYLIERALSIDNIFVFLLIFSYFRVPDRYQYRVLFLGIVGALVMRGLFIAVGAALLKMFHWMIYLFGAFLVVTGVRMAADRGHELHPSDNPAVRLVRRFLPVTGDYEGDRFLVWRGRRLYATPLLLVLVLVETTDVVFALDSIPAIFAVTRDTFIVYTSNVFAILGLRALYFLLAGVMGRFRYLKFGLSAVLVFVGGKMLISELYEVPIVLSLGIVFGILAASIVASLLVPARAVPPAPPAEPAPPATPTPEKPT